MTLELVLPPELQQRLQLEADRRGLSPEAFALQLLELHLPPVDRAAALLALFRKWEAEDQGMEPDPDYDLFRALDENRGEGRKLFPEHLKGISW